MQNGRQIDLSTQVQRVRRKTRPWKSIIALLLAIAAAVISHQARNDTFTTNHVTNQFIAYGSAVLFLVFGSTATYGLAGRSRELLEPTAGPAHSAIVRYAILIVGAFTTLVITLVLFGVDVSQLVLGGAITTVFLSIAAQQALGNVFAGLVLVSAQQPEPPQPRQQQQAPPPPPPDPLGDAIFPPDMVMQHQRELGLTDEQKTFMRGEINRATTRFNELQWQLQDAMEALHEEWLPTPAGSSSTARASRRPARARAPGPAG